MRKKLVIVSCVATLAIIVSAVTTISILSFKEICDAIIDEKSSIL